MNPVASIGMCLVERALVSFVPHDRLHLDLVWVLSGKAADVA